MYALTNYDGEGVLKELRDLALSIVEKIDSIEEGKLNTSRQCIYI